MKESASFSLLCHYLQEPGEGNKQFFPTQKLLKNKQLDWSEIIRLADSHYVLPLLYYQLKKKNVLASLPDDLQKLLTEVYTLNCERNTLIYNEINSLSSLFYSAGIEPVFLKGSAGLLMNLYAERGLRLMGDVDFLVNKKNLHQCRKIMKSAGYSPIDGLYLPDADEHYHGFPLVHDDHNIRFEIHERLADIPLLDSDEIFAGSRVVQLKDGVVRVPSRTHFAINNILHHQVFDQGIEGENVLLYQLADLYILREKHDSGLDWKAIGQFFNQQSLQDAFCFSIDMLKNYFNQPLPKKMPYSLFFKIYYRQNRNRYHRMINYLKNSFY